MRFLSNEDAKIVKKIIRGRMKFGVVFLLLTTLIFGLFFFAALFGNGPTEEPTTFDLVKLGFVSLLFYFVAIKFLILDSLKLFRRLADGDYRIYKFEIYRCWRERHGSDRDYWYFLEALYLGDDGSNKTINEKIDCDDYVRIKDYKYAHVIHFHKKDGNIKEYDNGVVIDTTKAGEHFFYKGTNTL